MQAASAERERQLRNWGATGDRPTSTRGGRGSCSPLSLAFFGLIVGAPRSPRGRVAGAAGRPGRCAPGSRARRARHPRLEEYGGRIRGPSRPMTRQPRESGSARRGGRAPCVEDRVKRVLLSREGEHSAPECPFRVLGALLPRALLSREAPRGASGADCRNGRSSSGCCRRLCDWSGEPVRSFRTRPKRRPAFRGT